MYTAFFVCVCVSVVVSIFTFTYYIGNMLYLPLYCVVSHCFNFDSLMRNWIWMWSHISIIIFNICLEKWRNCCLVEYRTTHWIVMVCTSSLHFVSFHWYAFFYCCCCFTLVFYRNLVFLSLRKHNSYLVSMNLHCDI